MGQEPRKATEVLIDLESKVDVLLDVVRAQDLNIKVLSNKLNAVMEQLQKAPVAPPKITVEAVQVPTQTNVFAQMPAGDPEKNIPVLAESTLPATSAPDGFRRNSRPETYVPPSKTPLTTYNDRANQAPPQQAQLMEGPKMPMQVPKPPPGRASEVVVPAQATKKQTSQPPPSQAMPDIPVEQQAMNAKGSIPVMQRIVDKNGKSVFLANVEITDLSTNQPAFKTKTNGTGKWMASLGIGAYRVVISKRESLSKDKLEATQDIQVDGSQSPLELPLLLIK
jgi:hypothetical protein